MPETAELGTRGSVAPWVRVVIVNYNAGPLLQRCIDALSTQTESRFEAVIVDNGSSDGSVEAVRIPDRRFKVRRMGENLGFAAANNRGVVDCQTGWIATLNPDAEPRNDWLEELRHATHRYPGVPMFGSTQLDGRNPDRVDGFGDAYSIFGTAWRGGSGAPRASLPADDKEVFSPCAAGALYDRAIFQSVGGFDESFFCYLEDIDLGFRLRQRGARCLQIRKAEILHAGSAIAGSGSDFFLFHSQRNRIWAMTKNLPLPLLAIAVLLQIAVVPVTVLRRGRGRRLQALKGVAAGLSGIPRILVERRKVQRNRVVGTLGVARMLVWDPFKALRQAPHFISPTGISAREF
jgi:N-acetylglucosaminyl-diphospho-decaprenol L-rhamnosyltransferase